MSCIDAACYRKKYAVVFLLLKNGISTEKIRERHQHFVKAYPQDQIRLIDERIEKIMDFFDSYLPRFENFYLVRQLQSSTPADKRPKDPQLSRYPTILKTLVSKHFEDIMANCLITK